LILTIIQKEDEGGLTDALIKQGFPHTRIDIKGSFLQAANTAFAVLFQQSQRDEVLRELRKVCRTPMNPDRWFASAYPFGAYSPGAYAAEHLRAVEVGGATIFELSIEECQPV